MSKGKFIFIDCGGHDGCSVIQFLLHRPGYECITFEPNPDLAGYYRWLPTRLIRKAVATHDGHVQFTIDPINGDGSSICAGKDVVYDHSLSNEQCPTVSVECVDLSGFVARNVGPDDYLCLKIDVEGAEYEILDKMIRDGSISRVKELYAEFHWDKCGVPREVHDRLVEQLRRHTTVAEWDAAPHSIHTMGWRRKLRRALELARIWPRQLLAHPDAQSPRPFPA
ncbi:MAG: FkbM family methyltransferase [Steroidobacteraceae bacterium]